MNFSYIIEGGLAGCAHPRMGGDCREALGELRQRGISSVVSLDERGIPAWMIAEYGLRHLHLPIPDMRAPTLEQARRFVEFVRRELAGHRAVAAHCHAGYGRTGTMLACYLVAEGHAPGWAMEYVRNLRPGSIETSEQEAFVVSYAQETE
ncbi:MAG: protein-tyrosine phosphatase family protein [bacterium]